MKIIVKAKTKAKITEVKRLDQPALDLNIKNSDNREKEGSRKKEELVTYKISVKEAPVAGKANEAIIEALAEYFDVAKSNITLISGQTSKQKVFEIK